MQRLWLLFAQVVTVILALFFIVISLKPLWMNGLFDHIGIHKAMPTVAVQQTTLPAQNGPLSYRDAAQKAIPSVVNIYTSKEVRISSNPLFEDPLFQRFFGDRFNLQDEIEQKQSSLGSGVIVSENGYILTRIRRRIQEMEGSYIHIPIRKAPRPL